MKRIIALFPLLFLLSACNLTKETETETFVIPEDFTTLNVELTAGEINIYNPDDGDNATVGVIIEKFAYALTEAEALEYIDDIVVTPEFSDGTYTLKVETPDQDLNFGSHAWGGANLTFNNIDQQNLIVKSIAGSVDCEDIAQGDFDLTAGTISVDKATGPLKINVVAGSIEVDEYLGDDLDLKAEAGDVDIAIKGSGLINATIYASAGNVSLDLSEDRSCDVELETEVGNISLSGVDDYDSNSPFPGISSEVSFILNEGAGEIMVNVAVGAISVDVE